MEVHESEDIKWFLDFLKFDSSDFRVSTNVYPLNQALSLLGTGLTSVLFNQMIQTLIKQAKNMISQGDKRMPTVSINLNDVTYQYKVEMKYIRRCS